MDREVTTLEPMIQMRKQGHGFLMAGQRLEQGTELVVTTGLFRPEGPGIKAEFVADADHASRRGFGRGCTGSR